MQSTCTTFSRRNDIAKFLRETYNLTHEQFGEKMRPVTENVVCEFRRDYKSCNQMVACASWGDTIFTDMNSFLVDVMRGKVVAQLKKNDSTILMSLCVVEDSGTYCRGRDIFNLNILNKPGTKECNASWWTNKGNSNTTKKIITKNGTVKQNVFGTTQK